jgi:hypothetical protein
MPEEESFAVFVKLMEYYRLRELYKPTMTELGLCMFQLECLGNKLFNSNYIRYSPRTNARSIPTFYKYGI